MDMAYVNFTVANPDFYDLPWLNPYDPPDHLWDELSESLHPLKVRNSGPWTILDFGSELPEAGWKIHISVRPKDHGNAVRRTAVVCADLGVTFKGLSTRRLTHVSQGKYADQSASGKVITCYPRNISELEILVTRLADTLIGLTGPTVLGDLPVPGTPLYLRYGAFKEAWTQNDKGNFVPAIRLEDEFIIDDRTRSLTPDTSDFINKLRHHRAIQSKRNTLDISDVKVLARSNAGGVYSATWRGQRVVLREARHHSGLDSDETNAVTRLYREESALRRLHGSGVAPDVLDVWEFDDATMLVTTFIKGDPLNAIVGRENPLAQPNATPQDIARYRKFIQNVATQAEYLVSVLEEHRVIHGDLHQGNLLLRDDGSLCLVDFESAALDGDESHGSIRALGLADPSSNQVGVDRQALSRLDLSLAIPLLPLLHRRPELESQLRQAASALISTQASSEAPCAAPDSSRLIAGILATATPERDDRLFPGDVRQFYQPRAGLGLLYGAAGVLATLDSAGHQTNDKLWAWLADRALQPGPYTRGLAHGLDGVAVTLARHGHLEEATKLANRLVAEPFNPLAPWWESGAAGIAAAYLELAHLLQREDLMYHGLRAVDQLSKMISTGGPLPGYTAGLLSGWAGVALALLRCSQLVNTHQEELLALAATTLRREKEGCIWIRETFMGQHDGKLLPYLGQGSAAAGIAAKSLEQNGVTTSDFSQMLTGVHKALQPLLVANGGLLFGRSGLMTTLSILDSHSIILPEMAQQLSWYTVTTQHMKALPASIEDNVLFTLGEHYWRCSTDLGTGAAGYVLALHPDRRRLLSEVLLLPRFHEPDTECDKALGTRNPKGGEQA